MRTPPQVRESSRRAGLSTRSRADGQSNSPDLGRAGDDYPLVYAMLKCGLLNYAWGGGSIVPHEWQHLQRLKRVSAALELELQVSEAGAGDHT